jgi:predicted HTH domain antitoxin
MEEFHMSLESGMPPHGHRSDTLQTLAAEEPEAPPQRLLTDVKRGEITVVIDGGDAVLLAVPLKSGATIHVTLLELAAQLYDKDLISLERTARIAGLSYGETIDEFGRCGIATVRLAPEEPVKELDSFGP